MYGIKSVRSTDMVCYRVSSHNILSFYRDKGGDGDNRYTPRGDARTLSLGDTDLVAE